MKTKSKKVEKKTTCYYSAPAWEIISDPTAPHAMAVIAARKAVKRLAVELYQADVIEGTVDNLYYCDKDAQGISNYYLEAAFELIEKGMVTSTKEVRGN